MDAASIRAPLEIGLGGRLGQGDGLVQIAVGRDLSLPLRLGEDLDRHRQGGRVVGVRLEAVLEGCDRLDPIAAEHVDIGQEVVGVGEFGPVLDQIGELVGGTGPVGLDLGRGPGLRGGRPGFYEEGGEARRLVGVGVEEVSGWRIASSGLAVPEAEPGQLEPGLVEVSGSGRGGSA